MLSSQIQTDPRYSDPAWLLPHEPPMVLLSRICAAGNQWLETEISHALPTPYSDAQGRTPAWVAIEYMAQTVSAYAGFRYRMAGQQPKIGFLLGTREFTVDRAFFAAGEVIRIRATSVLESDSEVSMFDCEIKAVTGDVIGRAQLKGVQPENPEDYL